MRMVCTLVSPGRVAHFRLVQFGDGGKGVELVGEVERGYLGPNWERIVHTIPWIRRYARLRRLNFEEPARL